MRLASAQQFHDCKGVGVGRRVVQMRSGSTLTIESGKCPEKRERGIARAEVVSYEKRTPRARISSIVWSVPYALHEGWVIDVVTGQTRSSRLLDRVRTKTMTGANDT